MNFVQTHPKLLIAASTVMNTVDPRNWVFTIALFFLDLAINTASIYFVWGGEWPAVGCMLAGLFLMAIEVPFIGFYFKYALDQKREVSRVFSRLDTDGDKLITREQAETLLTELPKGTFELKFSEALEQYSMDNLMWCHYQPRMFTFRFLEFSVAWLMFFASLMLIEPGQKITAIVAVQGVVSVLSLMMVLNDFFENYFRKYESTTTCLRYSCIFCYGFTLVAILAMLLAGYGFASLMYEHQWNAVTVNTTAVPQNDLIGFVTGWFLTLFIVAAFLNLAILNFCFAQCGYIEVNIEHFGNDDPIKLLGKKRPSLFRKKDKEEIQEGLGDSFPQPLAAPSASFPLPPPAIRAPKPGQDESIIMV